MQQRGEAHAQLGTGLGDDGDRVREHVLVPVDRVLLELHRVELGKELVGEPGAREEPQARLRVGRDEQLAELVADPLRAHDLEPVAVPRHRLDHLGVGLELERRGEPRRAQHPQRVVEERHLDRERRAQPAGGEVGETVERVDEVELRERERHRVDGEVAPREVGLDVVAEDDLGLAAVGVVHLGAERRDLEAQAVALRADGAEAPALEPQVLGPAVEQRLDGVGTGVGREVDVVLAEARDPRSRRAASRRRDRASAPPRRSAPRAASAAPDPRGTARGARAAVRSHPESRRYEAVAAVSASESVCCSMSRRRSCGRVEAASASRRSITPRWYSESRL